MLAKHIPHLAGQGAVFLLVSAWILEAVFLLAPAFLLARPLKKAAVSVSVPRFPLPAGRAFSSAQRFLLLVEPGAA